MFFRKRYLDYRDHVDGTYELLAGLILTLDNWEIIIVPKEYRCNGSSIPRFFWRLCGAPNSPGNIRAGFVHDYEYGLAQKSRKECDRLFYTILRHDGKSLVIAGLMYLAVRLFGRGHYGKNCR